MALNRRQFLHRSGAGGVGLLTFMVAGCERQMTPAAARTEALPYQVLSTAEAAIVDALGEQLVPGSTDAGLAHFLDHQLAAAADQQLLMIKYLGVPGPWLPFYQQGLAAVDGAAHTQHQHGFAALSTQHARALVASLAAGNVPDWTGPPAGLFYFVLRSDAVDVVYGTVAGFERLGIPYQAHIPPPSRWGE